MRCLNVKVELGGVLHEMSSEKRFQIKINHWNSSAFIWKP